MCRELVYLVCLVLVLFVGSAGAATITNVGSEIDFTAWRTAAVVVDPDGDGMYGTDGYLMFGAAGERQSSLNGANDDLQSDPAYAMIVNNAPGQAGTAGSVQFPYAVVDNVSGSAPGTMISGTTTDGAIGESLIATITIVGGVPSVFRLGLMHDNLDGTAFVSPSYEIKDQATDTTLVTVINETTFNQQPDWFFVDIAAARPGDVFEIHGEVSSNGFRTLGGITFDTVAAAENASNPSPADGATDVLRDVALNWSAGEFAKTHSVYLGTVFEDVNDGAVSAWVAQGTAGTGFDLGRLAFGGTYYWRVDEVNGAPDFAVFTGDVWSFTVELISIPIDNITATASSSFGASGPEKTVDGSGLADDLHGTSAAEMWISAGIPATIEYAFDRAYKLHELWIWNSNQLIEAFVGFGAKDVVIEHSLDGENWTVLEGVGPLAQAPGTEGYAHNNTIEFGVAVAQHVRVTVNSVHGIAPQASLSEVRFFFIPTYATGPNPATDATNVAPDTTLSWGRNGREADRHEIYVGTNANDLALEGADSESSFSTHALDLQLGTRYTWRVDEVNEAMDPSVWTGDLWSFTTADTITVDDMESYRDEEFLEIWATWIDGFDDPGNNGAVVGAVPSLGDFSPESTIVNGGSQSLPIHFDNSGAPRSEATRTFAASQDWSKHGVQGLVLSFHGSVDNTGGRLYVKVNDTQVVYDGDPADLQLIGWHKWTIDLGELPAATRDAVRSLTIGIDGGGSGVVYIDEIFLTP